MSFVVVSLVALLVGFAGSLPLAGPIALLVVSKGATGKYREALATAFGAAIAEGGYAFLAFWGFATFLARHPLVLPISRGVTAVILIALGARFIFFKAKEATKGEGEAKGARFWAGFSISALNPTLVVTWGAVTTFLYARQLVRFSPLLAIPFGVFAAVGIALWGVGTVALLAKFRKKLPLAAISWTVRVMGMLMIAVGVWSAVELVEYVVHHSASASSSPPSAPRATIAPCCSNDSSPCPLASATHGSTPSSDSKTSPPTPPTFHVGRSPTFRVASTKFCPWCATPLCARTTYSSISAPAWGASSSSCTCSRGRARAVSSSKRTSSPSRVNGAPRSR
jgi:threonine/homoserine/homoserine lactone efflux protein